MLKKNKEASALNNNRSLCIFGLCVRVCVLVLQAQKKSGEGGCSSASGPTSREAEAGGGEEEEGERGRGEEAAREAADGGEDEKRAGGGEEEES